MVAFVYNEDGLKKLHFLNDNDLKNYIAKENNVENENLSSFFINEDTMCIYADESDKAIPSLYLPSYSPITKTESKVYEVDGIIGFCTIKKERANNESHFTLNNVTFKTEDFLKKELSKEKQKINTLAYYDRWFN